MWRNLIKREWRTFCNIFKDTCIDSTAQAETVFEAKVKKLQADKLKPQEQLTLEPNESNHALLPC